MGYFILGLAVGLMVGFVALVIIIEKAGKTQEIGTLWVDRSEDIYDLYFEIEDLDRLKNDGRAQIKIKGTTPSHKNHTL